METWDVYLSGEIHTDWREEIERAVAAAGLPVTFSAPVTDHGFSDDCGVAILGAEDPALAEAMGEAGASRLLIGYGMGEQMSPARIESWLGDFTGRFIHGG